MVRPRRPSHNSAPDRPQRPSAHPTMSIAADHHVTRAAQPPAPCRFGSPVETRGFRCCAFVAQRDHEFRSTHGRGSGSRGSGLPAPQGRRGGEDHHGPAHLSDSTVKERGPLQSSRPKHLSDAYVKERGLLHLLEPDYKFDRPDARFIARLRRNADNGTGRRSHPGSFRHGKARLLNSRSPSACSHFSESAAV